MSLSARSGRSRGACMPVVMALVVLLSGAMGELAGEEAKTWVPKLPIQDQSLASHHMEGFLSPAPAHEVEDPDLVRARAGQCEIEKKDVYTNNADWLACTRPGFFLSGLETRGPYCTHESTMTIEKNSHRPGGDYKNFKLGRFGQERHCRAQCNRERRCVAYTYTKGFCYKWCKGTDVTYQSHEDRPDTSKRWHCRCDYYSEYPKCILKEKVSSVKAYDKCAITGIKNDPAVQETIDDLLPPPSNGDEQPEPGSTGDLPFLAEKMERLKRKGKAAQTSRKASTARKLMRAFVDKGSDMEDKENGPGEEDTNSAAQSEADEGVMSSLKVARSALPIHVHSVACLGWERHLQRCGHPVYDSPGGCRHRHDVGICCRARPGDPCTDYASNKQREGALRITSPRSDFQRGGRLEIFHGGKWGTICNWRFYHQSAKVACKQLGQPYASARAFTYGGGGNPQPTEATGHLGAQLRRRKSRPDPHGRRKYTSQCMPPNPYFMPMKSAEQMSTGSVRAKGGLNCITGLRCCRPEFVFELPKNETRTLHEHDPNQDASLKKTGATAASSAAAATVNDQNPGSDVEVPSIGNLMGVANGDENGVDNGVDSPPSAVPDQVEALVPPSDTPHSSPSVEDLSGGEGGVRSEEAKADGAQSLLQLGEESATSAPQVIPPETPSYSTEKAFWCDCYTLRSIQFLWTKNKADAECDRRGYYMVGLYKDIKAYLFQVQAYRCCRPCIQLGNELGLLQTDEAVGPAADAEEVADTSTWLQEGGTMVTENIQLALRTGKVGGAAAKALPPADSAPTNSASESETLSEGLLQPKAAGQSSGEHHWYDILAQGSGTHNKKEMEVQLRKDLHLSIEELHGRRARRHGLTVVVFDRKDPSTPKDRRRFNTHWSSRASHDMANYLNSLGSGNIVVVTSYYGWERRMTDDLGKALERVGAGKDVQGYASGRKGKYHPYALIGIPEIGVGAGVQSFQPNSAQSPFAIARASLVWDPADGWYRLDDSVRHSTFREKWCDCYEKTQKWPTLDEAPGYDKQTFTCDGPGKEGYLMVGSRRGNYHRVFNLDVWKCCKPCTFLGSGDG